MLSLILGGDKSGKSAYALRLFESLPGPGLLFGLGLAKDLAFREQILAHRLERSPDIPLREPGIRLPEALRECTQERILADSLDFWLFSCLEAGCLEERVAALLASLEALKPQTRLILVSSECGLGPLAQDSLSRRFARSMGGLNQAVAGLAQEVVLVLAGQPLLLKAGT